jgi:excisionase family DNA binding protein
VRVVSAADASRIALGATLEAMIERAVEEAVRRHLAQVQPSAPAVVEVLSVAQAAKRANYRQTAPILKAITDGSLPASRPSGARAWRIRASDLDAFLAGQSRATASVDAAPVDLAARRIAASVRRPK